MAKMKRQPLVVYTVGHSTRELSVFLELLKGHGIKQLVDVRTIPRSLKNPQYNAEALAQTLRAASIRYVHLGALGGWRRPVRDSINAGWRNVSFRGFADYMQSAEFEKGLERLLNLASARPAAIMCAEAVPWRCHRSLIADALVVRGARVMHIFSPGTAREHTLTSFAQVRGTRISYPKATEDTATLLVN